MTILNLSLGVAGLVEGVSIIDQLGIQFTGVIVTAGWTAAVTFAILKLIAVFVDLRVDEKEETEGLDLTFHEEKGYNL